MSNLNFVAYENTCFTLTTVHARGFAQGQTLTVVPLTELGKSIAKELPTTLPERAPVKNEDDRPSRTSPLSVVNLLSKVATDHKIHLIGALAFEAAHILEDMTLPDVPFFQFVLAECVTSTPQKRPLPEGARVKARLLSDSSSQFHKNFTAARDHFKCGDIFEIVLSRKFVFEVDPKTARNELAQLVPMARAPYRFALDFVDMSLLGASPELLVTVAGRAVTTRPISGSIRRQHSGPELSEDEKAQFELLMKSEKEKSELDMLIDLARHDLNRVCDNVRVSKYREPLVLESVIHTQATVTGELKATRTAADALFSCLNAGTLVGAPKKKAMELIAKFEPEPRTYYGGNLVHVFPDGTLKAIILIRTVCLRHDKLSVQAGATVLLDSDADYEYWECGAKAKTLLKILGAEELCYGSGKPPEVVSSNFAVDKITPTANHQIFVTHRFESKKLLLVDNEDSFTFNLAALFRGFGCAVDVVRNHILVKDLSTYDGVVLSPGPASPREAGHLIDYVKLVAGKKAAFGVCLGFQAMVEALGGELGKLSAPLHGKVREVIQVQKSRFFEELPDRFYAARYHSLYATKLPDSLRLTAEDKERVPLAIEGPADWPAFLGLQFHPESFLTGDSGQLLARNWLRSL